MVVIEQTPCMCAGTSVRNVRPHDARARVRVAKVHAGEFSKGGGCSHLARRLSSPALERMRECAQLMKAE